ncbi:MAG: hypothetical protein P9L97_05675 [Candidatus Tenebribacter davisii]|nr:hypothetical protein [Candidatus Tenebribacter davisii]
MKEFLIISNDNGTIPYVLQSNTESQVTNYLKSCKNNSTIIDLDIHEINTYKLINGELFTVQEEESEDKTIGGRYSVKQVTYSIHKKNGEKILKASYNFKSEKGWVWSSKFLCFDKIEYPREKAFEWLLRRMPSNIKEEYFDLSPLIPSNKDITTEVIHEICKHLHRPDYIDIQMNSAGYPEITEEYWEV